MTRQRAVGALTESLSTAIRAWMDEASDTDAWEAMGWIGNEAERLMAKAAMAVLESSADVQDYLKAEDKLKDDRSL